MSSVVASDTELRLLAGSEVVARHDRSWGRNQWFEKPEHRAALVKEERAARELKGRDRLRAEIPEIDILIERWVEVGRNLGSMVARTLTLLDKPAFGRPRNARSSGLRSWGRSFAERPSAGACYSGSVQKEGEL